MSFIFNFSFYELWEPEKSKMATRGPKMADGVYPQCLLSNVFRQEMFKTISYSSTLRSLRRSHQLSLNKLLDPSAPSMRKVDDGKRKRKEIIMSFLVVTNVIASWPPERRPTGTPTAHAKSKLIGSLACDGEQLCQLYTPQVIAMARGGVPSVVMHITWTLP